MKCAFNLNSCDEEVDEAECSQGCGCPYNMPYYNEEEMKCQSEYQFCPVSIFKTYDEYAKYEPQS